MEHLTIVRVIYNLIIDHRHISPGFRNQLLLFENGKGTNSVVQFAMISEALSPYPIAIAGLARDAEIG